MRKVTIEDISRETGLSRGTVSRALNDRPDISSETKRLVLDACRKLNYIPSSAARSLATGRNLALAIVASDLRAAATISFVRGVLAATERARYAAVLIELPAEPEAREMRIRSLSAERIDGVVLLATLDAATMQTLRDTLHDRTLVSGAPVNGQPCDSFVVDDVEAGRLAARRLVAAGARSAVYLARANDDAAARRCDGFKSAWSADGDRLGAIGVVLVDGPADVARHEAALRSTDAVATSDDPIAFAAHSVLSRLSRRPGSEVQLIGCGNECGGTALLPALTTIDLNAAEAGQRAATTLLQRVARERLDGPQSIAVAPMVVDRGTVAQARGDR